MDNPLSYTMNINYPHTTKTTWDHEDGGTKETI